MDLENAPKSVRDVVIQDEAKLIKGDVVPILTAPVDNFVTEENKDKNAPVIAAAERFVELVKQGMPAGKAAQEIGTTVRDIMTSVQMKAAVEDLMATAELAPEVRKRMLKAGLNKIFMRTVDSDNPKVMKIALEAAKQIGQDEGTVPPEAGVTINLGDLEIVRDKPLSLPGIEPHENHHA